MTDLVAQVKAAADARRRIQERVDSGAIDIDELGGLATSFAHVLAELQFDALVVELEAVAGLRQALVDLHESLFVGSERGLSKETLGELAAFAKTAATS